MTVSEYIRRKNELFKEKYNMLLVPRNQIIDVDIEDTSLNIGSDMGACPYCAKFYYNDCKECPMFEAGNGCKDINSTYSRLIKKIAHKDENSTTGLVEAKQTIDALEALVDQYNEDIRLNL